VDYYLNVAVLSQDVRCHCLVSCNLGQLLCVESTLRAVDLGVSYVTRCSVCHMIALRSRPLPATLELGMWWSQLISASVRCGFHVQNLSDLDADADLSRDQNYQLLWIL